MGVCAFNNDDVMFARLMILHHEGALALAEAIVSAQKAQSAVMNDLIATD